MVKQQDNLTSGGETPRVYRRLGAIGFVATLAALAAIGAYTVSKQGDVVRDHSLPNFVTDLDKAGAGKHVELIDDARYPLGILRISRPDLYKQCVVDLPLREYEVGTISAGQTENSSFPIATDKNGQVKPIDSVEAVEQQLGNSLTGHCA